jgi:hypothetical protein
MEVNEENILNFIEWKCRMDIADSLPPIREKRIMNKNVMEMLHNYLYMVDPESKFHNLIASDKLVEPISSTQPNDKCAKCDELIDKCDECKEPLIDELKNKDESTIQISENEKIRRNAMKFIAKQINHGASQNIIDVLDDLMDNLFGTELKTVSKNNKK